VSTLINRVVGESFITDPYSPCAFCVYLCLYSIFLHSRVTVS
jgi:hypothetical protein